MGMDSHRQIDHVQFHEDQIEAIRGQDGKGYVVVRRICENLGIDFSTQTRRLRSSRWAGIVMMTTPDHKGVEQTYAVIPSDSVPMWLATINESKVAERVRSKLVRYQLEVRDVLARHFLAAAAPVIKPWGDRIRETLVPHMRYVNVNHPGHFTVATTLATSFLAIEDELVRHALQPSASDRPDVSVGLCWANWRRDQGMPPSSRRAPLWLPDVRQEAWVCVYPDSERGTCEAWFHREYLSGKLHGYLDGKFRQHGKLPPASAADNACLQLAGHHASLPAKLRMSLAAAGGFVPVGATVRTIESRTPSLFAAFA
jgi:hypothetical protein